MAASGMPTGQVISDPSLKAAAFLSGEPGITHTIDESVKITNDLSIGTGSNHTGIITMNDKIYSSVAPSGTETSGGIATYDAALHFSIYGGKQLRFYNYDGISGSDTAYAGIKSSTETPSSGYTLTLPSGVSGKSGQYLMLSDNTGTLQWNSIAGATSPLLSCKVATTASFTMASTASTRESLAMFRAFSTPDVRIGVPSLVVRLKEDILLPPSWTYSILDTVKFSPMAESGVIESSKYI